MKEKKEMAGYVIHLAVAKEYLRNLGKDVKFYDGVTTWFKRLNSFAQEKGITLEHYIISVFIHIL